MNMWYYFDWFYEWGLHYATKYCRSFMNIWGGVLLVFRFVLLLCFYSSCCFVSFIPLRNMPQALGILWKPYTHKLSKQVHYYLRNGKFMIELLVIEYPRKKLSTDLFFIRTHFSGYILIKLNVFGISIQ